MKNLIITFAFIALALFVVQNLILGENNSIKTHVETMSESLIDDISAINVPSTSD